MQPTPLFAYNIYLIHLPILIVVVSLVYSATRYDQWGPILWEALRWGGRLTIFLIGVSGFLSFLNDAYVAAVVEEAIAVTLWGSLYAFNKF